MEQEVGGLGRLAQGPELVASRIVRIGDEHAVQPGAVSVTQSTELGTLYTMGELEALAAQAREHEEEIEERKRAHADEFADRARAPSRSSAAAASFFACSASAASRPDSA